MAFRERVLKEAREIGLVTLYFLSCFSFFLVLKKLLLAQYQIEIKVFPTIVVSALIVAKVVVVLEHTSFGGRFRSGAIAVHVFWRALAYSAMVFLVTLAERLFEFYRETGALSSAASEMWASKDPSHFLAMNMCVGLSFLVYNTFAEIDRHLGAGGLRRLFFSGRSASPGVEAGSGPGSG